MSSIMMTRITKQFCSSLRINIRMSQFIVVHPRSILSKTWNKHCVLLQIDRCMVPQVREVNYLSFVDSAFPWLSFAVASHFHLRRRCLLLLLRPRNPSLPKLLMLPLLILYLVHSPILQNKIRILHPMSTSKIQIIIWFTFRRIQYPMLFTMNSFTISWSMDMPLDTTSNIPNTKG